MRLSQNGDVQKIYVLAFGPDRFTTVNTDGSFHFADLNEAVAAIISPSFAAAGKRQPRSARSVASAAYAFGRAPLTGLMRPLKSNFSFSQYAPYFFDRSV